ncbi:14614_t:CDS:1, partial [Acaulospora colombiana]
GGPTKKEIMQLERRFQRDGEVAIILKTFEHLELDKLFLVSI